MDRTIVTGRELGTLIRMRRQANGFDLDDLSRAVGGTPGAAFLGQLEEGSLGPTSSPVLRLAAVLDLPPDLLLNAAGYATGAQRIDAIATLANGVELLTSPDVGPKSTAS